VDRVDSRANFVARLRATKPTKRPVRIMGHMDVVGVDSSKWMTPPFTATRRTEGDVEYLYGRGAIDDKGMLATATAAMQQLALHRDQLDRDVIFMATAAEEGGPEVGIDEMVSTPLYQAMEQAAVAMVPGTTVIPFMSTGATDGAALRAKGIPTYGILPMLLPMVDELRMHGDNERVPVQALGWAAEFLYRTLERVTAR
jgi:acetylornithine deacetylase/succinyl-diaminopimelate desuccinylase-like protein